MRTLWWIVCSILLGIAGGLLWFESSWAGPAGITASAFCEYGEGREKWRVPDHGGCRVHHVLSYWQAHDEQYGGDVEVRVFKDDVRVDPEQYKSNFVRYNHDDTPKDSQVAEPGTGNEWVGVIVNFIDGPQIFGAVIGVIALLNLVLVSVRTLRRRGSAPR